MNRSGLVRRGSIGQELTKTLRRYDTARFQKDISAPYRKLFLDLKMRKFTTFSFAHFDAERIIFSCMFMLRIMEVGAVKYSPFAAALV